MARKTQITKETILEAAFQMLLQEGYASISITSLAKAIGCSTQPIAWNFGSMDGLRAELLDYCVEFVGKIFSAKKREKIAEMLEDIAAGYIELAFDYPNLYKYFYMSDNEGKKMNELVGSLRAEMYGKAIAMLQQEYGVSAEVADCHMVNLQLYVHGIASYTVSKVCFSSKEVIMRMIHEANEAFLAQSILKSSEGRCILPHENATHIKNVDEKKEMR